MLSNRARLLIVMEMMEGGELFHRISQHRHFTEKQASQVTKQASSPRVPTKLPTVLVNQHNFIWGNKRKLTRKLYLISHCLLCYAIRKDADRRKPYLSARGRV